ncbi:ABC transporter ATP-binding protein [Phycicoccus endophyticus]|uniref:ABC transporter ATP-binding protein n=1 Tax=Phycicoccus endophyticus TaxID=1690220 RepID=A0A7G9QZP9_9MICO|nr:ABC transporter ATP-binding protein [Phycicoccus endophyticus]NHI20017.1 ABC transporter ATP-binding protein [Phycicoccus endophyticus]QNN48824.1 ABC transporter ATP-binding protein [Phycicoccus endophyticus]GGL42567.1 dipeptide/oligopeptide/nickel ABC transporter ATP-binding protein [Phycicoccus endophyticus]
MSELEFDHVTVRFGHGRSLQTAVDDASLVVRSGTTLGLVGESGSGKSTIARVAVGLERADAGSVRLDGVDLTARSREARLARRLVQMVFQDPLAALDPRMPVGASVAEGLLASGRSPNRADREARVRELLELVHVDPARAGDRPARFSGGQRQRLTIARALAAEPAVLVADEITSALDVSVQGVVLNLLRELQAELRLTMLFISHNLAVVRYVSDEVSVMRQGRIVEHGPTDAVLEDPADPYTRELLRSIPVMGRPLDLEDL